MVNQYPFVFIWRLCQLYAFGLIKTKQTKIAVAAVLYILVVLRLAIKHDRGGCCFPSFHLRPYSSFLSHKTQDTALYVRGEGGLGKTCYKLLAPESQDVKLPKVCLSIKQKPHYSG